MRRAILLLALLTASPALAGPELLFLAASNRVVTQTYSIPGTYAFTIPADAYGVTVTVAGGGGGGGTSGATPGGGDLVENLSFSDVGVQLDITVGSGGAEAVGDDYAPGGTGYPAGGDAEDMFSGGGGGGSAVVLHTGSVLMQAKGGEGGGSLSGDGGGTNSGGTITVGAGGTPGLSTTAGGAGWVTIRYQQGS